MDFAQYATVTGTVRISALISESGRLRGSASAAHTPSVVEPLDPFPTKEHVNTIITHNVAKNLLQKHACLSVGGRGHFPPNAVSVPLPPSRTGSSSHHRRSSTACTSPLAHPAKVSAPPPTIPRGGHPRNLLSNAPNSKFSIDHVFFSSGSFGSLNCPLMSITSLTSN